MGAINKPQQDNNNKKKQTGQTDTMLKNKR